MLAATQPARPTKQRMARTKLKQIAEARGLDIAKLSRRADLSYRTVWEIWNNPDRDVSLKTLEKIAAALGVAVTDLIENGPSQDDQGTPHLT